MKKLLLSAAALLTMGSAIGQQRSASLTEAPVQISEQALAQINGEGPEAVGDTILRSNLNLATGQDTLTLYYVDAAPYDSGFATGFNAYGDRGFAERYDISGNDSTIRVIGVAAFYDGRAQAASNKTIKVKAYRQGPKVLRAGSTRTYYNGKPGQGIDSITVNIAALRSTATGANGLIDTFAIHRFTNPTNTVNDSFFVGVELGTYSYSSLGGDTLNILTTKQGERRATSPLAYMQGQDTIRNVQNAVMFSNGTWADEFFENIGLAHHFVILALIRVQSITGLVDKGIANDDLTFFGSFPNPARTTSTVRFALQNTADVRVDMMDMTGRTVRTVNNPRMSAGQHDVAVSTEGLAAGEYIMSVRTSMGGAVGVQVTVAQ